MKKLICLLLFLLVGFVVYGQVVYYGEWHVVRWDASTQYDDESAFPTEATIYYEVIVCEESVSERPNPTILVWDNITSELFRTVTLLDNQRYSVGVRTIVYIDAGHYELSPIVWSDRDGTPNPWVVQLVEPPPPIPNSPSNLRADY